MRKYIFAQRYLGKDGENALNQKLQNFNQEIDKLNLTKGDPINPHEIKTVKNYHTLNMKRKMPGSNNRLSLAREIDNFIKENQSSQKILTFKQENSQILEVLSDWVDSNKILFKRAFYHRDLVKCINCKKSLD